eukprot:GDKJ01016897.1.p1 GENE.GDKJ01016897.1~~GDKJ01016897.1.p1  ORF type:complete len:864 (-),score=221.69 GDKJ01016897.1:68-2350(-)
MIILSNQIIRTVERSQKKKRKQNIRVLFVPEGNELCQQKLHELGTLSLIKSCHNVPIYLFPFDTDLISLERPGLFGALHCKDNAMPLLEVSDALANFEYLTGGVVPEIRALGSASRIVIDTLLKKRKDLLIKRCTPLTPLSISATLPEAKSEEPKTSSSTTVVNAKDDGSISLSITHPDMSSANASTPSVRFTALPPPTFSQTNFLGERVETEDGDELPPNTLSPDAPLAPLLKLPFPSPPPQLRSQIDAIEGLGVDGAWQPQSSLMVLLDRKVDLLSTLATPFTFEALLDASFPAGIKFGGVLDAPVSLVSKSAESKENDAESATTTKRLAVHSGDALVQEVRHRHIQSLGSVFSQKAKKIDALYKEKDSLVSLQDINAFMPKFKEAQQSHVTLGALISIAAHISKALSLPHAERLIAFEDKILTPNGGVSPSDLVSKFEEEIDVLPPLLPLNVQPLPIGSSFFNCMRLLSLGAITGLLKSRQYTQIRKLFHSTFGVAAMSTLLNMAKVGMLPLESNSAQTTFNTIRDGFKLLSPICEPSVIGGEEGASAEASNDLNFIFSGMAPLSIRIVQKLFEGICKTLTSPSLPLNASLSTIQKASWRPNAHLVNLLGQIYEISQSPAVPSHSSVLKSQQVDASGRVLSESEDPNIRERLTQAVNVKVEQGGQVAYSNLRDDEPVTALQNKQSTTPYVVTVMYIGGITWGEISGWRHINQQAEVSALQSGRRSIKFVIVTTEILTSRKGCLIQGLMTANHHNSAI